MTTHRSHPPSLLRHAERLARDERLFGRGDVVLCACSGGPDSTALLHVLASLRARIGHELVAHGVDHGLRAEAAAELEQARALADRLGVVFATTALRVRGGSNLQSRARWARHEALAAAARAAGASVVATGHTADDRAETLLLRLLRGAGPRGLAVLPPRAPSVVPDGPDLVRPLLHARRADVLAHLARHAIPFASDPSNDDPRFARVRVRHELLPLLEDLSPAIVTHLTDLADMLQIEHHPEDELGAGTSAGPAGPAGSEALDPADLEGLLPGGLPLGRAQRLAIERARKLGRGSVRLRVAGGREIEVILPNRRAALMTPR